MSKRKIIYLTIMMLISIMFMPNAFAQDLIGKVTAINNKDVIINGDVSNVVDNSDPKNVLIKYDFLTLKIIKEDLGVGRKGEAAWLGFKITKPSDATDGATVTRSNATIKIDKEGIYYTKITADNLRTALLNNQVIERKYEFDWNNDKIIDQNVTFIISPEKIVLKEKDSNNDAFNGPIEAEKLNQNVENPRTSDECWSYVICIFLSAMGIYIVNQKIKE